MANACSACPPVVCPPDPKRLSVSENRARKRAELERQSALVLKNSVARHLELVGDDKDAVLAAQSKAALDAKKAAIIAERARQDKVLAPGAKQQFCALLKRRFGERERTKLISKGCY